MLLKLNAELTEMVVGFLAPPLGFQPRELEPIPDVVQAGTRLAQARSCFEALIKPNPGEDEVEIFHRAARIRSAV